MTKTTIYSKKDHAFTLIELLVVIAIISLLVSILLPSLTKAREYAKLVTCQTNLRGIGMGVQYYVEDCEEYYPLIHDHGSPHVPFSLQIYLDIESVNVNYDECIFWCPGAPISSLADDVRKYSLAYNCSLSLRQRNDIIIPSEMVVYSDSKIGYSHTYYGAILHDPEYFPYCDHPDWLEAQTRHNDGANYIFLDQHVEWRLPRDILYGYRNNAGDPFINRRYWKPTYQ